MVIITKLFVWSAQPQVGNSEWLVGWIDIGLVPFKIVHKKQTHIHCIQIIVRKKNKKEIHHRLQRTYDVSRLEYG